MKLRTLIRFLRVERFFLVLPFGQVRMPFGQVKNAIWAGEECHLGRLRNAIWASLSKFCTSKVGTLKFVFAVIQRG